MNSTGRAAATIVIVLGIAAGSLAQEPSPAKPLLKDEMRMPWTRNQERYIRRWLVVGALPGTLDQDALAAAGRRGERSPV
jgi:hypothetical protein